MALVSASSMGEAVLGFGDGIASGVVQKAQDGGVFADLASTEEIAVKKELGRLNGEGAKNGCPRVLMEDSDACAEDAIGASVLELVHPANIDIVNVSFDGTEVVGKPPRLEVGVDIEEEEEEEGGGEKDPISNGRSHASDLGSPDHLVELVIQCLDEKVDRTTLTHEALELLRLVPEGYIPLPHQVGGHRHVDGKLGFLRKLGQEDVLYKPVQPGIKGTTEVQFYNGLFGSGELPEEVITLRQLVPGYYGRETIRDRASNLHEFLKLEDITHRYRCPCIMDVKVGRRVWDDFAEKEKIDRERRKYPAQETLGFRIIGMRVYQPSTGEYIYYDKWYGRSITEDTALQAVTNFFVCGEVNRVDIIPCILQKLGLFLRWFRMQTSLRLFASSLLIVYEGAPVVKGKTPPPIDIRLVDFAHTYETGVMEEETDDNTLYGLENFTQCLSVILKNHI